MKKRVFSMVMALAVLIGCMQIAVSAQTSSALAENFTWRYENGWDTLIISGTGDIEDYERGDSPFYEDNIKSVIIEDGITSIGNNLFERCSGITSVSIPDSVTSIGVYAFSNCESLESINIPDSVTNIGDGAFYSCTGLEAVNIPDGVTSIAVYTFSNCESLESVNIPDGVTSIEYGAFEKCSSLTSISIPDSVIDIGDYAFSSCSSLTAIEVSENNTQYSSQDGVLFDKEKTELIKCPESRSGDYQIPDGVTSIISNAFYMCSGITSIDIPDSVTFIGYRAFADCSGITNINMADSVEIIQELAFGGCSSLTSINIPDSVIDIEYSAFDNCSSLISIDVSENNEIYLSQGGVLYDKKFLELIKCPEAKNDACIIPEGIIHIAVDAFAGCRNLTSISMPDSLKYFDINSFMECINLISIEVSENNENYSSHDGILFDKEKSKVLRCPVFKSGDYQIPDGVIYISPNAFKRCSNLTSVKIPGSVIEIGEQAFENCSGLTSVIIPDGVVYINYDAFNGCSNLTSVKIPGSVREIGYGAFEDCSGLTSVIISDGVTELVPYVFNGCSSLESINIPNSVNSIWWDTFSDCSSLTSVHIPDSLKYIDTGAFENCSSLAHIYYSGSEEQWNDISIKPDNEPLLNAAVHYMPKEAYTINDFRVEYENVHINLTKNSDVDGKLIIAAYANDGTLIETVCIDAAFTDNEMHTIDVKLKENHPAYVRAYVWSTGMKPLCEKRRGNGL